MMFLFLGECEELGAWGGKVGTEAEEPGVEGDRKRESPRHPRERSAPLEALPVSD